MTDTAPTREAIKLCLRDVSSVFPDDTDADAILALFAPVIARLEQERDEARAEKAELLDERKQFAKDWLDEKLRADAAESALSAAKAEGMREGLQQIYPICAKLFGMDLVGEYQGDIEAAILAAIPETTNGTAASSD